MPLVFLGGLIGLRAGQAARGKNKTEKFGIASACRGGLAQFFLLLFLGCLLLVVVQGFSPGASGGPWWSYWSKGWAGCQRQKKFGIASACRGD